MMIAFFNCHARSVLGNRHCLWVRRGAQPTQETDLKRHTQVRASCVLWDSLPLKDVSLLPKKYGKTAKAKEVGW